MAKILLVDDDIELTALLKDILSLEGYNVIEANNGIEGLAAITDDLDLILLDIMMPKMNGMDMLRKLRETNETPVLMLTAKGEEIDRVIGLELGADDYLPKPFSDRELLARIRAILRRTQGKTKESNSSSIKYQDIELFIGKQEAYRNGEMMELTGTEFGLLSQFIQKPGEIISKEELSLEVLGKRLAPFDRAIDMHVSNLRKKLPPLSEGKPRIKTLRGRGYLFVEE
ncbi:MULTISPECIES: response regulator [Aliivibrio]|uniref:Response regulator n=2 Tax=Aliivibrio fischeri TaxID=668 RepID=A0A853NHD6_ALIFS|nr:MULTISPECIES: response regulator [Aliivibrio]EHN69441.1 DNA-binding response regulator in two-component regulatory system with CpxA [Aliivibrio fischeri SR5]MBD1568483.1 response regulator [Aliivibrio sp. S10_S31]MUJ26101.1 response regulator [Aliivibrio fischeri]MUK25449.1 response regulator [Aliivibrio fischeri]MUK33094.1 response regulator [Aliivibrio fischeri]